MTTDCVGSLKGAGSRQRSDHRVGPCQLHLAICFLICTQAKDLSTEELKQQGVGTINSDKMELHFEKVIRPSVEEGGRDLRRDNQANQLCIVAIQAWFLKSRQRWRVPLTV